MTEPSDILFRGALLTSDRLRRALDAARGEVIGGPGIKVNSVGGKTVVSLKGQRIIKKAPSGDIIIARITARNSLVNATYTVKSISLPTITLANVIPINRFFELDSSFNAKVDFLAAPVSDENDDGQGMAKIIKYEGGLSANKGSCTVADGSCSVITLAECQALDGAFVLGVKCPIPSGHGACSFGGDCAITDSVLCAGLNGMFVEGLHCPGMVVEITENVKISTCPAPQPVPALRPPPVISQIAGALN